MSRVSLHNAHDIFTDLENILDRICPLRTLEMAFQRDQDFKIFWGSMPPDPPRGIAPFTARLIHQ